MSKAVLSDPDQTCSQSDTFNCNFDLKRNESGGVSDDPVSGFIENKCSLNGTHTKLQQQSPNSTVFPQNEPTSSEDVMVVRTSTMGPYPVSLMSSVSPGPFTSSPMSKSVTSSASGSICRICLEGDCMEQLISPCDCMGSMSVVHVCCLEKWLSTSNLDCCEVCKFEFKVQRTPRPIIQWLFSRQSRDGPHGVCGDALCLLLLTPVCLTSVYLCGMGSLAYLQRGAWEGVGLAFLSLIVLFTFFVWGFTTVRFQWQSMSRWRRSNQTVQLVDFHKPRRRKQFGVQCNAQRSQQSTLPSLI